MTDSLFAIFAVLLYGLATVLVALFLRSVKDSNTDLEGGKVTASFVVASIGAACHIAYALKISFIGESLNASLSSMVVLVSGMLVVLFY